MRFLFKFFLDIHDTIYLGTSYKGIRRINFHLGIFNLFAQFYKLSLIILLCFYYIQIIYCYKHI